MGTYFKEIVQEAIGGIVILSTVEEVSAEEFSSALKDFEDTGYCDHSYVKDEYFWLYDIRSCAVCGKGLVLV